jgi:hypothetical protein
VCNARPELLEVRPSWGGRPLLELTQLSAAETDELVAALGIGDADVRARIAATAEGNPLFAEQLAVMVAESRDAPRDRLRLPASIQALLAARLDALEAEERRLLERAAVVGKEFWYRAVADLSPPGERPQVPGLLLSLARKGLVDPVRADAPGEDTFRFRHALIRDVAYGGMPKGLRAELHEGFATWLRAQPAAGLGEHDEIVGYHAEQAYRYRTELAPSDSRSEALAEQAAQLLGAAGDRALARDDMPAAVGLLERTASLMPEGDARRLEALRDHALALWETGRAEDGARALARLHAEAAAAGDERMVALAELERIVHEQLTGADVDAVARAAERLIELSASVGDDIAVARAWRRVSSAHRRVGSYSAAERAARKALHHARLARNRREEARAVDALCNCLLYGPTPAAAALETCEELLTAAGGSRTLEANVLAVKSGLESLLGDVDAARESYERAATSFSELGLELARAALTQIGVPNELLAGDAVAAEREARTGQEIFARFGSSVVQAPLLAEALHAQGRNEDARRLLAETAVDEGPAIVQWQVGCRLALARLALADDRPDQAVESAVAAVELAERSEDVNLRGDACVVYADALAASGRRDEAASARVAARALYEAKGNAAALARLPAEAPSTA